jgi:hypothetical protein
MNNKKKQLEYEYRYPAGAFEPAEILRCARAMPGMAGKRVSVRWALLVNHIFYMPGKPDVMFRIRDVYSGGGKKNSLMTLKLPPDAAGGFEQEYETWVEDGEATARIALALGLVRRHVMEKLRGTVELPGGGEIAFDVNPGLPASMEVECTSKRALDGAVAALGLGGPPTEDMRVRAKLEGQYAERFGLDGAALKARFRAGSSLTFSDPGPLRELVPAHHRKAFDREYGRQAGMARRFLHKAHANPK